MSVPRISVVIPAYRAEKTLDRCLKSIQVQSLTEFEVIIVDDGSPDQTLAIAKKWVAKDQRFRCVTQKNSGSGMARNHGLQMSIGEFVIFVDPDDWIDSIMLEQLLDIQQKTNSDLVVSKSRQVGPNGKLLSEDISTGYLELDSVSKVHQHYLQMFSAGMLSGPGCKLYRRSIIQSNKICFPDLRRSQDIFFNLKYISAIGSLVSIDDIYYNYSMDPKNYATKLPSNYYETIALIFSSIIDSLNIWEVSPKDEEISLLCTHLLRSVIANMEANTIRGESIERFYQDESMQEIVKRSTHLRLDQRIFRYIFIYCNSSSMKLFLRFRQTLKRFKVAG